LMMSLWDALRMNMMISYQELVRTFPNSMFRIGGSGAIVIDIDNTSTAGNTSSDGVIISDNSLGGFDLPVYQNGIQYCPDMGIRLTQVRGAILSENLINKAWKDGIKLVSSSEVIITGVVKDPREGANKSPNAKKRLCK
ncbi:hypothetical protein AAG991_22500, partial [Enterobacter kobei]